MRLEERRSAWLHFHAALIDDAATGNAGPAFGDQPSHSSQMFATVQCGEQLACAGFLRRVLKAAGGIEPLSAQWERRGRRRSPLILLRAATAICRRGTIATVADRHAKKRPPAGAVIERLAKSKWSGIEGARRTPCSEAWVKVAR
jgi:hypothetical protein